MVAADPIDLSGLLDDGKCFAFVRQRRWPEGVRCPGCGSDAVIRDGRDDAQPHRQWYRCKACAGRFDDLTGSVLGYVRARATAPGRRGLIRLRGRLSRRGRTGMRCIGCGSEAVTERRERTAQGYRRFRCRECGKQSNERSGTLLNRVQYPSDVVALVVLWRLRYKLSLRELPEMFAVRGIAFCHG